LRAEFRGSRFHCFLFAPLSQASPLLSRVAAVDKNFKNPSQLTASAAATCGGNGASSAAQIMRSVLAARQFVSLSTNAAAVAALISCGFASGAY
jgi:hypothetical protein